MNDRCTVNDDRSTTIQLEHPISMKKGKESSLLEEITIQVPKAKNLMSVDEVRGDVMRSLVLIESLSGVPVRVLKDLEADDLRTIAGVVKAYQVKLETSEDS